MKIFGHNNIDELANDAKENLDDLILASDSGDMGASTKLFLYYIQKNEGISQRAFRYILKSIEQGNSILAELLAGMYLEGVESDQFTTNASQKKAFKLLLRSSSFDSFKKLREIAGDNEGMWHRIIESANGNKLHPVYNYIITTISESLPGDVSRIKSYTKIIDDIAQYFIDLRKRMVVESTIVERENRKLTHYTDINALRSMLRLNSNDEVGDSDKAKNPVLRLYNVAYMNDPEEGMFLFKDKLKDLNRYAEEENNDNTYVSSFTSGSIDDLTMWRLYGRDGKGLSITMPMKNIFSELAACEMLCRNLQSFMDKTHFSDTARNEMNICLYEVKYDIQEIQDDILSHYNKLTDEIAKNNDSNNNKLVNALKQSFVKVSDEIRFLYKSEQYKVESEYRLLSFHPIVSPFVKLDERENPRLYINSNQIFGEGSIITIGPKVEERAAIKLELEYRLKKYGFDGVKVQFSNAKYR